MNSIEKRDLPIATLHSLLVELSQLGCKTVLFGQGEPMVCSNIVEAVRLAHSLGFNVRIATSGAGCTYNKLRRLLESGLTEIHISVNSFSEMDNKKTRMGYQQAINAIELATNIGIYTKLNYVAQNETIEKFPEYIKYSLKYKVNGISILREKVDRNGKIGNYSKNQLLKLSKYIRDSLIPIDIEECFCELKICLTERMKSPLQGCSAGRAMMAIGADGRFYPCSHLSSKAESFSSIAEYWNNSEILSKLREICLVDEPCCNCIYVNKCTACQAIYVDDRSSFYKSRVDCPVFIRK